MENKIPLKVNLEYGKYFNYGEKYHVSFDYSTEEQKHEIQTFFQSVLPTYGANGSRQKAGYEYIMPYYVDEKGQPISFGNTYGGTSIPEDILIDFLKRFIEVDKANVKVGNVVITGKINDELLNDIVQSIGPKLNREFSM